MSIILYGVTSGGTSVPIEVTEEGKLVVDTSKFPTDEFIKQGDDIQAGTIAAGSATLGPSWGNDQSIFIDKGQVLVRQDNASQVFGVYYGASDASNNTLSITGTGSINASGDAVIAGDVIIGPNTIATGPCINTVGTLGVLQIRSDNDNYGSIQIYNGGNAESNKKVLIQADGSITAASGNCGFTSDGELYFYSRGTRYKAVVQGGNMAAEPFSRATELQEKAALLKEQARQPKTQDIVPED